MEDGLTGANYRTVTVQDCIENMEYRNRAAILNDGRVAGFSREDNGCMAREGPAAGQGMQGKRTTPETEVHMPIMA